MSNILYIGPYREFSGRGVASRNYIRALVQSGHNISIRPIYHTFKSYPDFDIKNDILELENNFNKKYHTVIQHCYPHEYCLDKRFDKTIGIVNLESKYYAGRLNDYLSIPDELIAPSVFVKDSITESKDFNVSIIPEPIDKKEIIEYKNNPANRDNKKETFIFYIITDFIPKNNIIETLEAFWMAFDDDDKVDLVIKTKNKNQEFSDLHQTVEYEFSKIDSNLNKFKKKPRVIIGEIKKDAVYYIHNNCDCLIDISPSRCFGKSVLEALAFGNSVVVPENTAQYEIACETNNFIVESELTNCRDTIKVHNIYNTYSQKWFVANFYSLINNMKKAFLENKEEKASRLAMSEKKTEEYTIEAIAQKFKDYDI